MLQEGGVTNCAAEKLYCDTTAPSALMDFQTLAVHGDRVWQATKAVGSLILISRKTRLRRERRQTIARTSSQGAVAWCASLANKIPIGVLRKDSWEQAP